MGHPRCLVACVVAACLLAGCHGAGPPTFLTINGEPIDLDEFERRVDERELPAADERFVVYYPADYTPEELARLLRLVRDAIRVTDRWDKELDVRAHDPVE